MELREHLDERGRSPFRVWFKALDATAAARVQRALTRLEVGHESHIKGVGAGVFELKSILAQDTAYISVKMEMKLSFCSAVERRSGSIATSGPRMTIGSTTNVARKFETCL